MSIVVLQLASSLSARLRCWKALGLSFALLLAILLPAAAHAQNSNGQGNITGRVVDQNGAVVVGADVTITDKDTKVANTTKTNSSGVYNVLSLIPGTYTVKIADKGFKESLTDGVIVSAGLDVPVNATLQVGGESQVVTVQAAGELLSTTTDVSTTVDREIVENLPYPERSSLEAVLLVPGVVGDALNPGGIEPENPNAFTNYFVPGASLIVGGAPAGTTAIIVDGSDVLEASYPRAGMNLSGHDIQETTVIVGGISAQYGRTGGGVIVQASRGGTAQYHGGAEWRHTDPFFWAYTDGQLTKTDQHEQFEAFYFGGPVRIPKLFHGDDKTFFFASYEPALIHELQGATRTNFLSPQELAGYLHNSEDILNQSAIKSSGYAAALLLPRTGGVGYQTAGGGGVSNPAGNCNAYDPSGLFPCGAYLNNAGAGRQINGPLSDCTNNGVTQVDFTNPTVCHDDLAPELALNKFAQFINSQFPTPANPGPYVIFDNPQGTPSNDLNNAYFRRGVDNADHRYNIRIDHQFNNNNQMYVRYTNIPVSAGRIFAVAPTNPLNTTPTDVEHGYDISVGFTHVFTSNIVANAHYSWFRENLQRYPPLIDTTQDYGAEYGLYPAVAGYGLPKINSFNSNGDSYAISPGINTFSQQKDQNFITGADVTWTHGPHLFTFGIDYRWIQSNQYDIGGIAGGTYSFSPSQTVSPNGQASPANGGGSGYGSFLLGIESGSYTNTPIEVPGYYRYKYGAGYFQDSWRTTPKLTLNLGVRYEVQVPREEAKNNQGFVSATQIAGTLNGVATTSAFCFSGACGLGRSLWPTNWLGIEPRIGIAYSVSPKMTLRASYALTRPPLSGQENIPDPDFNISGSSTGQIAAYQQDYISNPVNPASLTSSYTQLVGRGPFNYSTGVSPVFVDQNKKVPNVQLANVSVGYQPFSKTLIQVSYQHTRGEHLYAQFPIAENIPSLGTLTNYIQNGNSLSAPYLPENITGATTGGNFPYHIVNSANAVQNETGYQALEPYQNFFNQNLNDIYPRNGDSHYDAMYLQLNQRATKTLTLLASYVWSKSLDDVPDINSGAAAGSGQSALQNPQSLAGEYSVSTFDQDSALKVGYNYKLPFGVGQQFNTGKSLLDSLIGGFSTSGFVTSQVGYPNYITLGNNGYFYDVVPIGATGTLNGQSYNCTIAKQTTPLTNYCIGSVLPSGITLRPNINPGVPLINPKSYWKQNPYNVPATGVTPYLNSAAFSMPGSPGNPQLGNAPRTLSDARSPRQFFFDASVRKDFTIKERYRVGLFVNLNNAFNHPSYFSVTTRTPFSTITTVPTATTFAQTLSNPQPQNTVTNPTGTPINASFGTVGNAGAAVMARVIRVGASINF